MTSQRLDLEERKNERGRDRMEEREKGRKWVEESRRWKLKGKRGVRHDL